MDSEKEQKKGLFIQALGDGAKKAIEMSMVTVATGLPVNIIFLSSGTVFVGSLIFKTVRFKFQKGGELNEKSRNTRK